jgi:glutamate dehydrogenase
MAVYRIAAAFAVARASFGLTALNGEIEELDNRIRGTVQLGLFAQVQDLLIDRMVWFLRNVALDRGLAEVVDHYRTGIAAVRDGLAGVVPEEARRHWTATARKLMAEGIPEPLAQSIARLSALAPAADIVLIADRGGCPIDRTAAIYFAAENYFRLDRIVAAAGEVKLTDYFDRLALDHALDAIGDAQRRIVGSMTAQGDCGPVAQDGMSTAVAAFVQAKGADVERVRQAVHEIVASGLTVSKLTVAAGLLGDLAKG